MTLHRVSGESFAQDKSLPVLILFTKVAVQTASFRNDPVEKYTEQSLAIKEWLIG